MCLVHCLLPLDEELGILPTEQWDEILEDYDDLGLCAYCDEWPGYHELQYEEHRYESEAKKVVIIHQTMNLCGLCLHDQDYELSRRLSFVPGKGWGNLMPKGRPDTPKDGPVVTSGYVGKVFWYMVHMKDGNI